MPFRWPRCGGGAGHHADARSDIAAATSKRLHADADSAAAWSAQPIFKVVLTADGPASRLRQSLLRHLPRVRVWADRRGGNTPVDVQSLLAIPRITEVIGCGSGLRAEEWMQVLSHPCTAGLASFVINEANLVGALPADLTVQFARLTRLDTVDIYQSFSHGDLLAALPAVPALTSLRLADLSGPVDLASLLPPALHACTRLTRLRLTQPNDGSRIFRGIFCGVQSPSAMAFLSRLEYLELDTFESIVPNTPAPELSAAFTAITGLRHLSLTSVEGVDDLLPFVSLLGGLTFLEICSLHARFGEADAHDPPDIIPTVPRLHAMLQRAKSLRNVTLNVRNCCLKKESPSDQRYAFERLNPDRFAPYIHD